ncbi:MAG: hypothetical protein HYS80_00115 [Candidatus Aenigmarchaeota archaeon]|nr:hypothetical protein [Candidatus Aenigmarchaeota archaeon]
MGSYIRKTKRNFTIEGLPSDMIISMGWDIPQDKGKIPVGIQADPDNGILKISNPQVPPIGMSLYIATYNHEQDLRNTQRKNKKNVGKYYKERNKRLRESMSPESRHVLDTTDWDEVREDEKNSEHGRKVEQLLKEGHKEYLKKKGKLTWKKDLELSK